MLRSRELMTGTLYIVATPIGNLEDITLRAIRVLREAGLIACEDTRHTRRLLDHYGIEKPLLSFHEHNERDRTADLLERLRSGEHVAVVSDAGTPLISDPGYRLVEAAARDGIRIVPIPGPSAVLTALAASGLPTNAFFFGGFLPPKATARRRALAEAAELDCVAVFYEAPHRLLDCLQDIAAELGDRPIVIARELTKIHEEFSRGAAQELAAEFSARPAIKGEITLLIGKPPERPRDEISVRETFQRHLAAGMARMDAMKATARECGVSKREVYAEIEKG